MPLIVPGINDANNGQSWVQKLSGKKITETGSTDTTSFAKKDLPSNHRVVGENDMLTMDHQPERSVLPN